MYFLKLHEVLLSTLLPLHMYVFMFTYKCLHMYIQSGATNIHMSVPLRQFHSKHKRSCQLEIHMYMIVLFLCFGRKRPTLTALILKTHFILCQI